MSDLALAYSRMMRPQQPGGRTDMEAEPAGLIPSLPDDVFLKCLLRVPVQWHANLQRTSRSLRKLVQGPEYYEQRMREGTSSALVCMLQPLPGATETSTAGKSSSSPAPSCDPVFGVSVLDVHQQLWERLPPVPGLPEGLPTFCKLVALNGVLVVLGGWFQSTWEPSRSVWVYNFSSQTWRNGADMPNVRSFFACAALGGMVYVAGGHDAEKKALVSADVYDVERDCWSCLPTMREERDECAGATLDGKLYVVSGYKTESQGAFVRSAEVYDPASNLWSSIDNMWPLESEDSEVMSPGSLAAMSGHLYALHGKEIVVYSSEKNAWSVVGKIPEGEKGEMSLASLTPTKDFLVVTGLAKSNDTTSFRAVSFTPGHGATKSEWQSLPSNDQFSTVVQASCALEI